MANIIMQDVQRQIFGGAEFKSGRFFCITTPHRDTGRRGGRRRLFLFWPISSFVMSKGRFFRLLNSNLEQFFIYGDFHLLYQDFFGSHPPWGRVWRRRRGGGRERLIFWPISSFWMSKGSFFRLMNSNLEDFFIYPFCQEFFGLHPPRGVHRGEGGGEQKVTFLF